MKDYEDIERDQAQGILRWRGLRPSSRLWIDGAREAVNRVRYTDAEILVVAGNRIRAMEASRASDGSWWETLTKVLRDVPDAREPYLEINGQELQALMRLAGVRERDPVVGHHPYRVRYEYFRRLVLAAYQSTED